MINKLYPLVLLLLFITCDKEDISSFQSDSFIKFFNPYPVFISADVKQTADDGFAVLGTVETNNRGMEMCLILTDEYGNSIDIAHYFGRELDDKAYCLQSLPDGFGILGSSENPQTGTLEVYFIRTDLTGDTLWTRTIGMANNDIEASHFEVSLDGSFIMTGYMDTPTQGKQIWLFSIDRNGDNAWPLQRVYGGPGEETGAHLQILGADRIVITGSTSSYPIGTRTTNVYVLVTNNLGGTVTFQPLLRDTLQNQDKYQTRYFDEEAKCIRILEDGSFLIVGTAWPNINGNEADILLRKVNLFSGTDKIVWERYYSASNHDTGESLLLENDSFVILGTFSTLVNNSAMGLIYVDQDGIEQYSRLFGQGSQMVSTGFDRTSDNGFVLTGSNIFTESHASVSLIKTKPDGSL